MIERLAKHRPFRIEDVKELLTNSNGDMMKDLLDRLWRTGYPCIYRVANPTDFNEDLLSDHGMMWLAGPKPWHLLHWRRPRVPATPS